MPKDEQSITPPNLSEASWLSAPETQAVFAALQAEGATVRVVGGAVRNSLLGTPVNDIDMATSATPDEVLALAASAGLTTIPTGLQHGTITVRSGGISYEVTTLRHDVETDGRHARIAFTDDWTLDAARRDFTMNALYCEAGGTIFDPLGGYQDVLARRVRFIGEAEDRIGEDYLRILRFFRFNAQYLPAEAGGFAALDAAGLSAAIRMRRGLQQLSAERIHAEMMKILAAPAAMAVLRVMCDAGLLPPILGAAPRLRNLRRLMAIETALERAPDPNLRLAALTIAVSEDVGRLSRRLRLSGLEKAALQLAVFDAPERRLINTDMSDRAAKQLLYRAGVEDFSRLILLAWARSGDSAGCKSWQELLSLPDRWRIPELPVGGADIMALGIAPGPAVGDIIRRFEAWWIGNEFPADRTMIERQLLALSESHAGEPRDS